MTPPAGGGGGGGGGVASCDNPGTSAGYEACRQHPECECISQIITCANGGWVTQYSVTPSCTAASGRPPLGGNGASPPVAGPGAPEWPDAGSAGGASGGGGATPNPMPAPVHTDCSSQQAADVTNAFKDAGERLARAINRMNDAQAHPQSATARQVNDLLKANFGIGNASCVGVNIYGPQQVLTDLKNLLDDIGHKDANGHTETPRCPDQDRESPNSTADERRFVNAAPSGSDNNDFIYYPRFFAPSFKPNRARTVIHEMAHSWLGRTDVSYHGRPGYPGCPNVAMGNADSIASFAFDLGQ